MKCSEIIQFLEERTPTKFAMDWDNVGLLVGRREREIHKILVTLDVTNEIIEKAILEKVDMIVSHHPMLFSSVKSITDENFLGEKLLSLIEHGICCYAMHTNYDVCQMADLADSFMGFENTNPLEVTAEVDGKIKGIGSVCELNDSVTLASCVEKVKKAFHLEHVLLFGDEEKVIKKVALSPGSGRHMLEEALNINADVLITGDMGHHEGLDALDMGMCVIEAGHHGLEQIFIQDVTDYLKAKCKDCQVLGVNPGGPYQVY